MSWPFYTPLITGTPDIVAGKSIPALKIDVVNDIAEIEEHYVPYSIPRAVNAKLVTDVYQSLIIGSFTTAETRTNIFDIFNGVAVGELVFVFFGRTTDISLAAYFSATTPDAPFLVDVVSFSAGSTVSEMYDFTSSSAAHPFGDIVLGTDAIIDVQQISFSQHTSLSYYQYTAGSAYYFSSREKLTFASMAPSGIVIIPRGVPTNATVKVGVTVGNVDGFIYGEQIVPIDGTPSFTLGGEG